MSPARSLRATLLLALTSPALLAQVQWTTARGMNRLSPRSSHALAHDSRRGRTVLFGGNPWRADSPTNPWGTGWKILGE